LRPQTAEKFVKPSYGVWFATKWHLHPHDRRRQACLLDPIKGKPISTFAT
jgi:hypothetical protein